MKTTAVTLREKKGQFLVETLDVEAPKGKEVLVRIAGVGLCHTDLSFRDFLIHPVPLPMVLGHEGAGVVESVGEEVTKLKPGDHVVLCYSSCQACPNCTDERSNFCYEFFPINFSGLRSDGSTALHKGTERVHGNFFGQSSFSSFALASEKNTIKVSKEAPLELLGPFGCGFQTGAGAVMNALAPEPGSSIAIFGCGSVGLAAVIAAKISGCAKIIAVDITQTRLDMAKSLGATYTINPKASDVNVVETIFEITSTGADYSLECAGIPQVLRQAFDCLGVPGVCGVVGAPAEGTEVALDMSKVFGKTLIGIISGDSEPASFIPELVRLYQNGDFPIDSLIKKYPLKDINQAVADTESGHVVKAILIP